MKKDDPDFNDMVQLYLDEGYDRSVAIGAVLNDREPPSHESILNQGLRGFPTVSPYDERGDVILGPGAIA